MQHIDSKACLGEIKLTPKLSDIFSLDAIYVICSAFKRLYRTPSTFMSQESFSSLKFRLHTVGVGGNPLSCSSPSYNSLLRQCPSRNSPIRENADCPVNLVDVEAADALIQWASKLPQGQC
jgi:hypothetical protein